MTAPFPPHPGTVTCDDGTDIKEVAVEEIPLGLRFAETKEGWVPVVRITARTVGVVRRIYEYGAKGELLRSTVQRRG
jgi:glutaredoxin